MAVNSVTMYLMAFNSQNACFMVVNSVIMCIMVVTDGFPQEANGYLHEGKFSTGMISIQQQRNTTDGC